MDESTGVDASGTPQAVPVDEAAAATDPLSSLDLSPEGIQAFWENNSEMIVSYAASAAGAIIFLFIAFIIAGWARRVTTGSLKRAKVDITLAKFLGVIVRWVIVILAIVASLRMFGIETTSFVAIIGAAGLAIALSFQGALSNLASGVMLLLFRPFKVGDVVSVGGNTGKVDEIGLTSTSMDTPDNRRIIVPNSDIFGATIENISHHMERRADVEVGIDYSADIDATRAVLQRAGESVEGRDPSKDVQVYLKGLGASSVDWVVRIWTTSADFWAVKERGVRAVKVHLDEAGIGIPFPQMDVHLDGRLTKE